MDFDPTLSLCLPKVQKLQNEFAEEGDHEKQDIISRQPNEILIHILSLFPECNEQVMTGILSTKWKDLWAFLPDLRLVMPLCVTNSQVSKFSDFVERILILRNGMPIRRFSLFLSTNFDYTRFYEIICAVIECEIHELGLEFPSERVKVPFPWLHFIDCKSLVALTLKGWFILDVPANVVFPSLKYLNLLSIIYSGEASVVNHFSGCHVLENLHVERLLMRMESDNIETFNISVLSLKVLWISFAASTERGHKFVLDTPNLERFQVLDLVSHVYIFKSRFSILGCATLQISSPSCVLSVLQGVSAAKFLHLGADTLHNFPEILYIQSTLVFQNLVNLSLASDKYTCWRLLFRLLERMPNLVHLVFNEGLMPPAHLRSREYGFIFNPPARVPACLRTTLTTIEIHNSEALSLEELFLVIYFVQRGTVVETVTINRHNIDPRVQNVLLKYDVRKVVRLI